MSARSRSVAIGGVATVVMLVPLIGLGVWQLQRLAWKEALIAAVEERVGAPAVDLPEPSEWSKLDPRDYEYRHVRVTGVYDLAHQLLVFRASAGGKGRFSGPGYNVMTPLTLLSGETILVNRGFVPESQKGAASIGPIKPTTVSGLMRASEDRTWFTPADDPAKGAWFTRDVEAMAAALKLGPHAPFSLDADAGPEPLPEGGDTIVSFPNSHLSYAVTWFGMALALVGVYLAFAYSRLRAKS